MFCRNCGKEIEEKDVFCAYCGLPVKPSSVPIPPKPPEPVYRPAPSEPYSPGITAISIISLIASCLGIILLFTENTIFIAMFMLAVSLGTGIPAFVSGRKKARNKTLSLIAFVFCLVAAGIFIGLLMIGIMLMNFAIRL